jgi:hypothetical protein
MAEADATAEADAEAEAEGEADATAEETGEATTDAVVSHHYTHLLRPANDPLKKKRARNIQVHYQGGPH